MTKPKTPKVAGFMRSVLAQNLEKLMEVHLKDETNKPMALQKLCGVKKSTVQRILARSTGANLETLEAIAGAFGLSVYQLLIPELRAENPQIVQGATKAEEAAYRRWRLNPEPNVIPLQKSRQGRS